MFIEVQNDNNNSTRRYPNQDYKRQGLMLDIRECPILIKESLIVTTTLYQNNFGSYIKLYISRANEINHRVWDHGETCKIYL